jgi:hypothetical protein
MGRREGSCKAERYLGLAQAPAPMPDSGNSDVEPADLLPRYYVPFIRIDN